MFELRTQLAGISENYGRIFFSTITCFVEDKDELPPPLPGSVLIGRRLPVFVEDKDELPPPLPGWLFVDVKNPLPVVISAPQRVSGLELLRQRARAGMLYDQRVRNSLRS